MLCSFCDLTSLIDDLEYSYKNGFVNGLNSEIQRTSRSLINSKSKLKVLSGEDFNLLIHSASNSKMFLEERDQTQGFSLSVIDSKNIRCYQPDRCKFAFYGGIDGKDFACASTKDNASVLRNGRIFASQSPDYLPFDKFKTETTNGDSGISEINVNKMQKPNAIVCFDYVTKQEAEMSKKYGLDVVMIQTECYPDMKHFPDERTNVEKVDLSIFEMQNEPQITPLTKEEIEEMKKEFGAKQMLPNFEKFISSPQNEKQLES